MIVKNVITIIFVVITGTAFVRCAVSKHRPKLKKEEIGHKLTNDDVLRALSDFGVVRRSLNPVVFEQYSNNSIQYLKMDQNIPNVENKKNIVIEKLKLSVTFRDNILYIFSYLLHGRENGLTEEQYTSLQTLYEFLKKKMVYIYNLLPIVSKLHTTDKNQQTSIILLSLSKNLPAYIQCTAKYLASEIELQRINLNVLLKPTEFETFNYLANIDLDTISKGKIKNEELIGYDKYSNVTHKALGPVFVKVFSNLQTKKLLLSQELFGLILINLPNPSDDPVLEENIRFLYDLTKNNVIDYKYWDSIGTDPVSNDAYTLVFSVLTKILNSNVQMIIKDAAVYVYHHLKLVTVPTYVNSNFKYINHLTEKNIDIRMLLSAVIPQDFDSDVVNMKNSLLTYFMHNYKNEDMNKILKGFNKFAYSDPLDLLLAFVTRLTNRVSSFPNTNSRMLQQPVTALLPALIMKKYSRIFTPFVSPEIDVLMLLDSVKTPDADPILQSTVDSIKLELIAQPQMSVLLSTLIPTEKSKCLILKQCLMNTFQQVQKLQNIPLTLITKIQSVVYMLKTTSQPQQQSRSYTQHSIKPADVNLYLGREKPVVVAIETDSTYTNNMPNGNTYNGVPYVWNIDKYVGKIGPVVQDGLQVVTSKWESGVPTYMDSAETKVVSTFFDAPITTDQITKPREVKVTQPKVIKAQVTEYVPTREDTSDQSLTTKSSFTTSISNVPSLTYSPTQKPRRKQQLQYTTSTKDSIVEENTSEEYTSEHIPESIYYEKDEKEIYQPSSTSEEIEDRTSPLKEVTKKVTTKKFTEVTAHTKSKLPQKVEEKVINEKVSSAIVLPPTIETDLPLKVQLSNSGVPVVTTGDNYNTSETEIILPDIKSLLKSPEINDLMRDTNSPIVTQVLRQLFAIFGKNYMKKIKKDVEAQAYPTTMKLLFKIFNDAVTNPEVTKNTRLTNMIHKYIASMEYVSPTILLPIIVSSKKLVSNVVYSTFNPNDLTYSRLDENPPDEPLADSVTVPLVNPKILLQSINPSDPYADLLPTLEEGNAFAIIIRHLKKFLTSKNIKKLFGSDFQPLMYTNKLSLLITLLRKIQETETIQSQPKLKSLINIYIQAFKIPSITIQVSEDKLVKMMSETTGQWQPELTSLISALPTAKNDAEINMIEKLEQFLADPILLEKLRMDKPPLTMSRGDLLHKIILSALSDKIRLEKLLLKALKYYKDKVDFNEMGALPIIWMWVETTVVKAEIQLGDMIQQTVNFDQLAYKEKLAYNDLITYLAQNPNLLEDNEDFNFEKYETQGEFIKGLFQHLLKKPEVNDKIKKDIQIILPRVSQTGAGAVPMPSFSSF